MARTPAATTAAGSRAAVAGVRRYTVFAAIALAGVATAEVALFLVHRETRDWVQHSRDIARIARTANTLAVERENRVLALLVTQDPQVIRPEAAARRELARALDSLVALTADNPAQQSRARETRLAVAEWDSAFAQPVLTGARPRVGARDAGQAYFDRVQRHFAEFIIAEEVLYDERLKQNDFVTLLALLAVLLPLGGLASVFAAMGKRVSKQATTVLQQQQQLEEQAVELEQQVEELETANQHLTEAAVAADRARDEAIRESTARTHLSALLDSALQSAPLGFAFFDTDLRYVRANPVLARLAERTPEELVGRTLHEVVSPHLFESVQSDLRHVLATGKPVLDVHMVTERPLGSGNRRELIVSYYPVKTGAGQLVGAGAVVLDVTERAKLEQQVRHAQKMEAVGRVAGGVAHDFNNLLTVIRSYCDLVLLEMRDGDPKRDELLEIRSAADRAAELAKQMIVFSKQQVVIPRAIDLNDVVKSMQSMMGRLFSTSVQQSVRLAPDLGAIKADPGQVEQVLLNLAMNAADAMIGGGRFLMETSNMTLDAEYARLHAGVVPGEFVMVLVSDTGTGMDRATMDRMFEPFFTTKPPGKGTGLGLSTAYGIVTQSGGHIWVYSEPGQGTTFKVYFPRVHEEVSAPRSVPTGSLAPEAKSAKETVLLVEDEPSVRATLTRVLQRQGYTVLPASHGGEAMRVVAETSGPIDLVISDLTMPEMSGREFVQRLSSVRPTARVLFMSGFSDDEAERRGLLDKRQNFIEKPFTVEQITRKVREVLEHA